MMVKKYYLENATWSNLIYLEIDAAFASYFTERVNRVIERHQEKYVFEFAARAVMNQYRYGTLPDRWLDSGLFERLVDDEIIPISPAVLRAMYESVKTDMDRILQFLADTECRGTAFEMFIKLGFLNQKEFTFPVKRLDGTNESSSDLKLSVFKKVDQDKPVIDDTHLKYEGNTMVVCYQNHPVVDLVIYSEGVVNFQSSLTFHTQQMLITYWIVKWATQTSMYSNTTA
jgi:hypothetical protein